MWEIVREDGACWASAIGALEFLPALQVTSLSPSRFHSNSQAMFGFEYVYEDELTLKGGRTSPLRLP